MEQPADPLLSEESIFLELQLLGLLAEGSELPRELTGLLRHSRLWKLVCPKGPHPSNRLAALATAALLPAAPAFAKQLTRPQASKVDVAIHVLDADSGRPVPGARVVRKIGSIAGVADQKGQLRLNLIRGTRAEFKVIGNGFRPVALVIANPEADVPVFVGVARQPLKRDQVRAATAAKDGSASMVRPVAKAASAAKGAAAAEFAVPDKDSQDDEEAGYLDIDQEPPPSEASNSPADHAEPGAIEPSSREGQTSGKGLGSVRPRTITVQSRPIGESHDAAAALPHSGALAGIPKGAVAKSAGRGDKHNAAGPGPAGPAGSPQQPPGPVEKPAAKSRGTRGGPIQAHQRVKPSGKRAHHARKPWGWHALIVVRPGDSLWRLAGRHLRNPFRWREIYRLNLRVIANPNLIFPGQRLRLPRR